MFKIFSKYYLSRARRYFASKKTAKVITVGLFLLVLALLFAGLDLFFQKGLLFLNSKENQYFTEALSLYVYEVLLLMIALLVMLSGLITGMLSLFKGKDDAWILETPNYRVFPKVIFLRMYLASLWPVIIGAFPLVLAVWKVYGLNIWEILLMLFLLKILVFVITLLDLGIILLVANGLYFLQKWIKRSFLTTKSLVGIITLILVGFIFQIWTRLKDMDFGVLLQATNLNQSVANLDGIVEKFQVFPSHLVAYTLLLFQHHEMVAGLRNVVAIIALGILLLIINYLLLRNFLFLWQVLQEGQSHQLFFKNKLRPNFLNFSQFFRGPISAIFFKEAMIIFRDLKNVMWLMFSIFLWLFYTAFNVMLNFHQRRYQVRFNELPNIIPALQIIVIVYFVSTLVLRFALPAFSTERKTAWVLASSPLNLRKLFLAKAIFYSLLFLIIGIIFGSLGVVTSSYLASQQVVAVAIFFIAIIFVTIFGLAMGAIFPNFDTDDVQALSTSLPGLSFIAGSLFYGGVATWCFFLFVQGHYFLLVGFYLISIFLVIIFYFLATRALRRLEFVKDH